MLDDDHFPHDGPTEDCPTEGWARDLLLAAADTIEVRPEPRPFVATPRRVAWIPLAAAATVLAVLGIVGATQLRGTDRPPAIQPSPPTTTSESLGPDQIPSVFGYDATGARLLLESKGLAVRTRLEESCDSTDRAVRTTPPVGSRFTAGDAVTLVVTVSHPLRYCVFPHARTWEFVDFANGRGAPPEFAPEVTLTVNGESTILTAAQAADPANWPTCDATLASCPGSALDVIQQASAAVRQVNSTWEAPTLSVQGGWEKQRVWIGFPTDGIFGPQWHITLHWQPLSSRPTRLLTAVDLTWEEMPGTVPTPAIGKTVTVPSLVGLGSDEAISTLTGVGFAVEQSTKEFCGPEGLVLAQSPEGGTNAEVGDVVTLQVSRPPDIDPGHCIPASGTLRSLRAFARGNTDQPPVAARVDLYLGNVFQKTITREEAADPANWELCADYNNHSCPMSALITLRDAAGVAELAVPSNGCVPFLPDLPPDLRPMSPGVLEHTAALESPEPASCFDHWAVQLWTLDSDRTVVNLVLGEPDY